jgi:hypothetical protein
MRRLLASEFGAYLVDRRDESRQTASARPRKLVNGADESVVP